MRAKPWDVSDGESMKIAKKTQLESVPRKLSQSLSRTPPAREENRGFMRVCGDTTAGLQNLSGVVAPRSVGSTPAPLR